MGDDSDFAHPAPLELRIGPCPCVRAVPLRSCMQAGREELEPWLLNHARQFQFGVQEELEDCDTIDPLEFFDDLDVSIPLEQVGGSANEDDDGAREHASNAGSSDSRTFFEAAPSSTQGSSQCGRTNTPFEMPIACTGKGSFVRR